jgi:hypothetical protein
MTFLSRLFYASLFGAIIALSACAGSASKNAAPEAAAAPIAASPIPAEVVSATPQPAAIPGGAWPPPEASSDAAADKPLTPGLTTAAIDLKAKRDPKVDLEHRAIERWALLIAKQTDQAFTYLTPGYQKSHDAVKYAKQMGDRPVRWIRVTYNKADCQTASSCEVHTMVDYKIRTAGMGAGPSELTSFAFVTEHWLQVDGVWYHLPSETGG